MVRHDKHTILWIDSGEWWCSIKIHLLTGYEVWLTAPCAAPKAINLEVCILCQKRSNLNTSLVVKLAGVVLFYLPSKLMESCDIRASRVGQVTVLEQGIIKYHASSCYRSFQRDMGKRISILTRPEQCEPTPFQVIVAQAIHSLTRSKELITALCQHEACVGYRRIDVDLAEQVLAEQVIATAGAI